MTQQRRSSLVRKPLRDMTPQELIDWLADQQGELEDFASYAQGYVKRRVRRRKPPTLTDERYERFLEQATDLIAGLEELRELVRSAQEEQEHQ